MYSGLATYHPSNFQKNERPITGYPFPCTAVGTLTLMSGILLCAHVVESSTKKERYQAEGKKIRLVWLQQPKTVSDQVFESFAIVAKEDRAVITTSSRASENKFTKISIFLRFKTILGTMTSLCGFIVQFIGLRGMH